jgi:hypothetical protein
MGIVTVTTVEEEGAYLEDTLNKLGIKTTFLKAISAPQEYIYKFDGGVYTDSALKKAMNILNNLSGYTYEKLKQGGFVVKRVKDKRQFISVGNCQKSVENAIANDKDGNGKQKCYFCFGMGQQDYIVTNLQECSHILIAGSTGSGKSCLLNALIIQILAYSNADMILIDPKQGAEFGIYEKDIHSRIKAVAKDTTTAIEWLERMVNEMESRYSEMAYACDKVYNGSRLVIVIDELADLMMTSGKQVENYIQRLAQKGRAAGIHLIVATQDPRVSVITGVIKSNLPTKVCLKTANIVHSRNVIDVGIGAELLGKGDAYISLPTSTELIRSQTPFITDENLLRLLTT